MVPVGYLTVEDCKDVMSYSYVVVMYVINCGV